VTCKRVDRPTLGCIVLCFAPLRGSLVEDMAPELRRHTILVDEEGRSYAAEAEATRDSFGLLGLVEPSAWSNWRSGLYVAWGVFGRESIATRAGLSSIPNIGLQPAKERLALPETPSRVSCVRPRRISSKRRVTRTTDETSGVEPLRALTSYVCRRPPYENMRQAAGFATRSCCLTSSGFISIATT
jgi:hypothetical protein